MNVPRLMTLFHISLTVLGILALLLMASGILTLDWLIVGIVIIAVILNALFSRLWHEETTAKISKTHKATTVGKSRIFPMVSLIVSVYNQEHNIDQIVKNLFTLASDYRGPSEIIIVDDGSPDNTYESASTAIGLMHREHPNIRAHVTKHMAHLGATEAAKTGVNKAMGEFLTILDSNTPSNSFSLNELIDAASTTPRTTTIPDNLLMQREGSIGGTRRIRLYSTETFRSLLNEKQNLRL